jgi:hypothetical protein
VELEVALTGVSSGGVVVKADWELRLWIDWSCVRLNVNTRFSRPQFRSDTKPMMRLETSTLAAKSTSTLVQACNAAHEHATRAEDVEQRLRSHRGCKDWKR